MILEGQDSTKHKDYAKVVLDEEGRLTCHICGRTFRKLGAHVVQKHFITTDEYRAAYGLYKTIGLVSQEHREQLSALVSPKIIKNNLIRKGKDTRYKKGAAGRKEVVPQLFNALSERGLNPTPAMISARKANGERAGKSGAGNTSRWSKEGRKAKRDENKK